MTSRRLSSSMASQEGGCVAREACIHPNPISLICLVMNLKQRGLALDGTAGGGRGDGPSNLDELRVSAEKSIHRAGAEICREPWTRVK
jgi:hypothetical protein